MTDENVLNQLPGNAELLTDSSKKRKAIEYTQKGTDADNLNWEKLYKELVAERVTQAESLLNAYRQESDERENLMRSYNQELEQDNKRLKSELSQVEQLKQQIHLLEKQLENERTKSARQDAMIDLYQALTGATISNLTESDNMQCDVVFTNQETKVSTKCSISTVQGRPSDGPPLLRYKPIENPNPLPEFLRQEIEFDKTQLPPLLQNILRGIFPEE